MNASVRDVSNLEASMNVVPGMNQSDIYDTSTVIAAHNEQLQQKINEENEEDQSPSRDRSEDQSETNQLEVEGPGLTKQADNQQLQNLGGETDQRSEMELAKDDGSATHNMMFNDISSQEEQANRPASKGDESGKDVGQTTIVIEDGAEKIKGGKQGSLRVDVDR